MSDTDDRKARAQYGEYASPQEQERARGLVPAAGAGTHPPQPSRADSPAPSRAANSHPVDRVVTLVLLALGLFLVLNGIPGYLAMPAVMQGVYDSLDAGTYAAGEVASSLGVTALILQSVIWIAAALLALTAIRRGRLAWWIAAVGGAVAFIVVMVIVSAALFADPGFLDSVSAQNLS